MGGEINLPREVYQLSDGSLGSRIDEKAKTLFNKGKISNGVFAGENVTINNGVITTNKNIENYIEYSENVPGRNYVSFDMKLGNSDEAGYALKCGEKTYYCTIYKSNGKVSMCIGSPDDKGHPSYSLMDIQEADDGIYHIELTIDHQIFEFHVNDLYSLSARTSFWSGDYTPALYSTGTNTEFSNIKINKLANLEDVYD